MQKSNKQFRFLASAILWSLAVHAMFILQAWFAMQERSLIYSGWPEFVFYPHRILIFFLPPGFPFDDTVVSNWKIVGNIADVYPASLAYGAVLAFIYNWASNATKKLISWRGPIASQ